MKYETNFLTSSNIYELLEKKNRSYNDYRLVTILKMMNEYVAIVEKKKE